MSKYIYKNIDSFLKRDSKFIKTINPKLKETKILNTLSNILGWKNYNELQENIENKKYNKIFDISELKYEELKNLKEYYFHEIYKNFPIEREYYFNDPYQIMNGRIFKIVNKKSVTFEKEKNNCLTIDFSENKTFIKFKNYQTELFIDILLNKMHQLISGIDSMWVVRQLTYIQSFVKAIKNDVRNLDFQTEIMNMLSFNYLLDYTKDYLSVEGNKKENLYRLINYIRTIPGFSNNQEEISPHSLEEHGYIVMPFHMLENKFFDRNSNNLKTYNLDDLINHNGSIKFIYEDEKNNLNDIKVLYEVISKLKNLK